MPVSFTFVFIAIFFVLQSQCAPINPTSETSVIAAHLDGGLNSVRIAPDALNANLPRQKVDVGTPSHLLSHDKKVGLQALDADHLLSSEILAKRSNLLPVTGLTEVVPVTSPLDSIKNLGGSPLNSIHQISSLDSVSGVKSSVPGLTRLEPAGAVSTISNVSPAINGLGGSPSNLLTKRGLPFAGSLPMGNSLAFPGGASPLGGSFPAFSNNPASGVLSRLPGAGGLPGMNSFSGLANPVSDISGPTSKFTGPVSGLGSPMSEFGGIPGLASLTPGFGDSGLFKRKLGGLTGGLLGGSQVTNSLPLAKNVPLAGNTIPKIGTPFDFINGILGSSGGLPVPLNSPL